MSILRREVFYVQPRDKQVRFTGFARVTTTLGSMMEPFEFNHDTPNRGIVDFDPSDPIARVDRLVQVENEDDPFYDGEAEKRRKLHGGGYHPRVFLKTGNF